MKRNREKDKEINRLKWIIEGKINEYIKLERKYNELYKKYKEMSEQLSREKPQDWYY